MDQSRGLRRISWLVLIPYPAVLIGSYVMWQHGIPARIWGQNIGFCLLGTILLVLIYKAEWLHSSQKHFSILISLFALVAGAATFCFPSLNGVHRWATFGGMLFHTASIALPIVLIVWPRVERGQGQCLVWLNNLVMGMLLLFQPDAAEATGFTFAAVALILIRQDRQIWQWLVVVLLFSLLLATWFRPDPLEPVAHVEGIIGLAAELSPVLAMAAVASLTLALLPFAILWKRESCRCALVMALGLYFVGTWVAALSGRFPVALLGYGGAPIVGNFIALGWVLRRFAKSGTEFKPLHMESLK